MTGRKLVWGYQAANSPEQELEATGYLTPRFWGHMAPLDGGLSPS